MAQPVDHLVHLDVTMVVFDGINGKADQFPEAPMEPSFISDLCVEI